MNIKTTLLLIPSLIWLGITTTRHKLSLIFDSSRYRSSVPVICVGNCSAGGNGKTPTCIFLANYLAENKKKVGLILRGYKGSLSSNIPLVVTDQHTVLEIGDEARMYKKFLKDNTEIVICKSRTSGIKKLEELGVDIIIMDDGLQHLKVKPTLSFCLVDISESNAYCKPLLTQIIPNGRLREDPALSFNRADYIIFISREKIEENSLDKIQQIITQYNINKYCILEIIGSQIVDSLTFNQIPKKPALASLFTTIAKPGDLIKTIKNLGIQIVETKIYNDHQQISWEEWEKSIKTLKKPILCTSKDYVKIIDFPREEGEILIVLQEVKEAASINNTDLNSTSILEPINNLIGI